MNRCSSSVSEGSKTFSVISSIASRSEARTRISNRKFGVKICRCFEPSYSSLSWVRALRMRSLFSQLSLQRQNLNPYSISVFPVHTLQFSSAFFIHSGDRAPQSPDHRYLDQILRRLQVWRRDLERDPSVALRSDRVACEIRRITICIVLIYSTIQLSISCG